ncbi:MAG: sialidase family protein, partial [Limisphaerales bacterium]
MHLFLTARAPSLKLLFAIVCLACGCISQPRAPHPLAIVQRTVSTNQPGYYRAYYGDATTSHLVSPGQLSTDNGRTWSAFTPQTKFQTNLPYGYRRDPVTTALDARTGRVVQILNALDTSGLDPKAHEPKIAQQTYYLRYRVSLDAARTWLFDEPILQNGPYDAQHPVDGVWVGTNAIYLGDFGCIPVSTHSGKILVPAQATVIGPNHKLYNPTGGHTYTEVLVLIGTWNDDNRLTWNISDRVRGDPSRTTRGLIEPTLAQFPDHRLLMVMRGSNGGKADPQCELPSYKWVATSTNDGVNWSKPEPFTYDDGTPFNSPSS